ncbi:single-stranded-DNA-specific exonuclease RecJ [Cytobacillus solani]|uniref:Single-stranded-DNA-specific exonuclease RecJ n=1 Tax=Cytobacillus solani TaxID=1637975 RepID=A0A0Q3TBP5_9BACI|nr:single-stranded-DNA-specific exonuclease RecJ [Cytobacillus solani]KQL20645.1 single-stranded-DNA-specific exonuclease RecJ [Cytobacillus solani]USK53885.1 single-stranded-DNA-specific exonuclease RecJ [Cytobacillus solani]
MLHSKTRWIVRNSDEEKENLLVQELNITPLVASLLVNRGLETPELARHFLFDQKHEFHDPFLLTDMNAAVSRIKEGIENQEAILIFGDYDADGVTSTTVMMKTLQELGANVEFYIPNRFTEGYGPNIPAFQHAAEAGIKLIITVDTGIAAVNEAKAAKELGLDLIITDHHEPGPELPEALAIIHPKLENSEYPFRDLAGVGVAFKLAHALLGRVPEHLLEIAAIGTIADLVSLKGENRLIVKKGIKKLQLTSNVGLKALLKLNKVEPNSINEETIGFLIAPRLNAAGRLESADPAVDLLLTEDSLEAEAIAEEIEQLNKDRKSLVNEITEQAIREVEEKYPLTDNAVLVIGKEGWNAGVIGIVASKLVDKFYRPAIVLSYDVEKGLAKGSARSIAGFDLFKNLSDCREILPHFGGHPMAAGMTLKLDDVNELRSRLNTAAKDQLSEEDFIPVTQLDGEIALHDIHLSSLEELQMLSPYGMDNPKPKIMIKNANISAMRKIGSDQNHLKMTIENDGHTLDGVGFGLGSLFEHISPSSQISVIGELSINEWNNIRKPQMFLQDIAIDAWQLFDVRGVKRLESLVELIPKDRSKWIVFNQENMSKFQRYTNDHLITVSSEEEASALFIEKENVILIDLPDSKEILAAVFAGKKPARVYAHFYNEKDAYFSTIPTRDHFKWFYALLVKKGPFDLRKYGDDIAKFKGWSRQTIDFMSKVFFELDFVKIENGFISVNKATQKRDLTDSLTYQKVLAQYTLERDMVYSSYQQLKRWFDEVIQGSVKYEEEMKEWT